MLEPSRGMKALLLSFTNEIITYQLNIKTCLFLDVISYCNNTAALCIRTLSNGTWLNQTLSTVPVCSICMYSFYSTEKHHGHCRNQLLSFHGLGIGFCSKVTSQLGLSGLPLLNLIVSYIWSWSRPLYATWICFCVFGSSRFNVMLSRNSSRMAR